MSIESLLALVSHEMVLTAKEHKALVERFTDLLQPYGIPPTPLHQVLHEAAQRAGWRPPSPKIQQRQDSAARARTIQREYDLAHRRVLVAIVFKNLPPRLRQKPGSLGTAQAIIRRLDELPFERKPPITVRTIQADILFMRKNGNFGI